jgi:long-subunit fatty acid transport protein
MAQEQSEKQVQAVVAAARGSSARGRFDVANDQSSVIVRNPAADASPARANTQVRTYTIKS